MIESPDLAAFLVVQLGTLADLAAQLDLPADEWLQEADAVRSALLTELWSGDGFHAIGVLSGARSTTTSLLNLLPVVMAEQLPGEIADVIAARAHVHLTEFGLATEPPTSAAYTSDGYWRGPVWAPSTAIIEDATTSLI